MPSILDGFGSPLMIQVGWALLHFLWQGVLVTAIALGGLRALRHASSHQRYLFLLTMFGIMTVLPPLTFWLTKIPDMVLAEAVSPKQPRSGTYQTQPESPLAPQFETIPEVSVSTLSSVAVPNGMEQSQRPGFTGGYSQQIPGFLVVVWACGVCLLSLRLILGWIMMTRVRRTGLSAIQIQVPAMCTSLCLSMSVRSTVQVFESVIVQVPAVVGWFRPLILLPTRIVTGLSDEELRAILAHELAHIRRHDYLVNLGQLVVENLLFYHPVVWWLSYRIRQERENCCDDIAAQACGSRVTIARALATLAEINARTPAMLPAATGGSLIQRIRRLLQTDAKPERFNCSGIVIGILCLIVPLLVASCLVVSATGIVEADDASIRTSQTTSEDKTAVLTEIEDEKPGTALRVPSLFGPPPRAAREAAAAQQAELAAAAPRMLMKINGRQMAADDREADEQAEQLELSKVWSLTFPAEVQENELAGVIVDEKGQPLAGAKVDLYPAFTGHETITDEKGIFRYSFENAGKDQTVEVRFSKDGYSPIYRRNQSLGVADLRIILSSKTYLKGVVVDKNSKPIPLATVIAAHPYSWRGEYPSFNRETRTSTDADGRYRLYLNPEVYAVSVISEGHGVERVSNIEVLKDEAQTLDLHLNDGVTFRARVLDADSKEPVAGFTLYHRTNAMTLGVSNADGMIEIPNALPGDEEFQVGSATPAMGPGYYSCPTEPFGSWWSPDAKKPWHRTSTTEVGILFELSPEMDLVTFYVRSGVLISGKVIDPDGNPVAQATVAPARTGTGNSLTGDTRYSVETKDDGSYVVCLPSSGDSDYNMVAHDGKYSQWRKFASGVTEPFRTKPGQRLENVDIQLHKPATVRGRVTASDGRSLKGLAVRAHAVDKLGNRYYDPTTITNEDGTFEVTHIRPGEHFIQVEPFWLTAEDAPPQSSVVVELTEGETEEGIELMVGEK